MQPITISQSYATKYREYFVIGVMHPIISNDKFRSKYPGFQLKILFSNFSDEKTKAQNQNKHGGDPSK